MICPLCRYRFEKSAASCATRCPLHASCHLNCCPNCGYQFPGDSRILGFVRRLFTPRKRSPEVRPGPAGGGS